MGKILSGLVAVGLSLGIAAAVLPQRKPLVDYTDLTSDGRTDVIFRDRQGVELSCLAQQPDGGFHATEVTTHRYLGPVCSTPEGFYSPDVNGQFLERFPKQTMIPPQLYFIGGVGAIYGAM